MSNIQQQTSDDRFLVIALKQDDKQAFTRLFHAYYKDLVLFGGTYIPDKSTCEDIVQNIFLKLWNDRKTLEIENSLKSYLLKAVRNYCLDELRHRRIIDEHVAYELKSGSIDIDTTENYILYSDLCRQLKNALEQLPPQEREVFEMSRLENIKYQEIANPQYLCQNSGSTHQQGFETASHFIKRFLFATFFLSFPLMDVGFSF